MTKHKSIQAWAEALGSKAKTHAGQRRAILKSFRTDHTPLYTRGDKWRARYEAQYNVKWASNRYDRLDRLSTSRLIDLVRFHTEDAEFTAACLRRVSSKAAAPSKVVIRLARRVGLTHLLDDAVAKRLTKIGRGRSLTTVRGARSVNVSGWTVTASSKIEEDWERYSKGWHSSHGPARSESDRRVTFRRAHGYEIEEIHVPLKAWRGAWLENALVSAGIVESDASLRHIRLHPAYRLKIVRQHGKLRIYERLLGDLPIDYVAVAAGKTYHAETSRGAVRGLRAKFETPAKSPRELISSRLCKKLGFCEEGVRHFCLDFDLDPLGEYTAQQIFQRVQDAPQRASAYADDLIRLGEAVGFNVPAQWT